MTPLSERALACIESRLKRTSEDSHRWLGFYRGVVTDY